jgi:hypothetical protein
LLAALGLVWAAGRFHAVETSGSPRTWQWRPAVAASVVFLVLYMVAGSIMLPFFRDFYVGRPMPGLPALVALQLVRGLVWVAIAFPCLRRIESRTRAVFVLAVTFAVLGAIAPLLPPNAAMPERIRLAHMVEMTMSHVLFGMFTAWVFTRRRVNPAQPGGNETADEGRGTRMDPEKIGVNRRASAVPLN